MIKLSLIVPIYKVENYIIECLESVCSQLVEDVEVILINDGTPDRSMDMAKEYIYKNYRHFIEQFIFIDQENQGQSVARNNAINNANGKYIAFLDSDDYLLGNYIVTILEGIDKDDIDLIYFNAEQFDHELGEYKTTLKVVNFDQIIINNEEYRESVFRAAQWYPWLRVIRRDIISNYSFPDHVYMEDKILFPELYYDPKLRKIMEINKSLICYRHRIGSSIRSGYNKALLDGVNLGVEKFTVRKYPLFSILYNQFFSQKISIMIDDGVGFFEIISYIQKNRKNIELNYNYGYKIWILKNFSILYVFLLKLKKLGGSDV